MNIKNIGCTILIASLFMLTAKSGKGENFIKYHKIGNSIKIKGKLGESLGRIITISGKLSGKDYRRSKGDLDKTLLMVNRVNGKVLGRDIIIEIKTFGWAGVKKPVVGRNLKYAGYETGGMTGIPDGAFKYLPRVATAGYHFSTYFQVCKELR